MFQKILFFNPKKLEGPFYMTLNFIIAFFILTGFFSPPAIFSPLIEFKSLKVAK
jgi:hypothetical protein